MTTTIVILMLIGRQKICIEKADARIFYTPKSNHYNHFLFNFHNKQSCSARKVQQRAVKFVN